MDRRPALVSVVIPARDAAPTIGEQLAALAAQDYEGDFEVVVVDNGSTDGTSELARAWGSRLPSLTVVHATVREGPGYARNAGAAAAAGDFLAYCDADDVVCAGWLTSMTAAASAAAIVGGPLDDTALNDDVTPHWRPRQPVHELPVVQRFLPATASANLGIWRSVLAELGGWREDYGRGFEDVELCWRAQLAGHTLAFAPGAVVAYRYRTSLRALWRQYFGYGLTTPRLFRDFRACGMPRSDARTTLGAWKWLLVHLRDLPRSRIQRGVWVRIAATRTGRLAGSVRYRAFFP